MRAKVFATFLIFSVATAVAHLVSEGAYFRNQALYDHRVSETTAALFTLERIKVAGLRLVVESHELVIERTSDQRRPEVENKMPDSGRRFAQAATELKQGLAAYRAIGGTARKREMEAKLAEAIARLDEQAAAHMQMGEEHLARLHADLTAGQDEFIELIDELIEVSLADYRSQKKHAWESVQSTQSAVHTVLVLIISLGGIAAFLIIWTIVKRLGLITDAAKRVARGDLDVWVDVASSDELGAMATAFNRMVADLAQARRVRKTSQASLRKLSSAVEQSANTVVITDTAGTIEYVNQRFTRLTGYRTDEAVGKNPSILKTGHTSQEQYRQLWDTITSGRNWRGELLNRKKNGETYWAAALISPIKDPTGKITNYIGIQEDITERKRVETALRESKALAQRRALELEQAVAELRKLDERKTQFLSTVSHELRTPLTSILSAAGIITRYHATKPDDVPRFGKTIISEGKRLGRLIDNLLDLTKIESGKVEWNDERLDAKSIVAQVVDLFRPEAQRYGVELKTELPTSLPPLWGDRDRFVQVLTNLLSNAIKFTPSEGTVTITVAKDNGFLLFGVRDTGVGIPEDELDRVFERFHQVPQATYNTGKPAGSGLGLAICFDIVERYGGRIWAESRAGAGTTVLFRVPIMREETAELSPLL